MTPKAGEVYMLDLGYEGKVRPVVIMSREDSQAPRALSLFVPLTKEFWGSRYEVPMPRVPWRRLQSYTNVQAIGSARHDELTERRGRFDPLVVAKIKDAIRWAMDL
ncbi:Growth inhibitor [Verrucomicrobia bacterium]|nr:Growth inhibitor [Verrucomicrobiota bacterium]